MINQILTNVTLMVVIAAEKIQSWIYAYNVNVLVNTVLALV